MLVLNRRPGESIIIEPDLRLTVLSVTERRVWIGVWPSATSPALRISATVLSDLEARLEIGPLSSVSFDGDVVRIVAAGAEHPASAQQAGLAINRTLGQRVKGNPSLTFGGEAVGDELTITLIRPAGSYVRIGVDAPMRRVYREELWESVQAAQAGGLEGTDSAAADAAAADAVAIDVPADHIGDTADPDGALVAGTAIS
jgi:sRNA-binding carbon storage regulator CsrA